MDNMNINIAPKASKLLYHGEGGLYESWSPDDLPMLQVANVGAAKLLLHSHSFAAPSYSDSSKVAYVLQGNGVCGLTLPKAESETVFPIKEGDTLVIQLGYVSWWLNPNESDLIILFLGDTSKSLKRGEFINFYLSGPTGIVTGFRPEFESSAWELSEIDVSKFVNIETTPVIVKLEAGQKMPELSDKGRDRLVVNCHEAPLDIVDVKGGGSVVILNRKDLPTLELVCLRADFVRLHGGAMCSLGFSSVNFVREMRK